MPAVLNELREALVSNGFICQLKDGRVLAIEYKGKHFYTADDAGEKRAVGAVWAARSGGRCLFAMPTKGDFSEITAAIR